MKPKHSNSTIRPLGQRSLIFRPHPPNQFRSGEAKAESKAKSVSFSDYLNRKLHSSAVLPLALQRDGNNHTQGPNQYEKRETNGVIEESVFKQFNLANANDDEVQVLNTTFQGCRKRTSVFQAAGDERSSVRSRLFILGDDVSNRKDASAANKHLCNEGNVRSNETQPATKKRLVVLGDDPKPKRGAHGQSCFSSEQPKPQYNHYENGAGWWDYEREGVDNDEVGANQVWEGIGSTTLGEIVDWH